MSVLETAQFTRTHGSVYNLLKLYTVHTGPLPCLQTTSDVRREIVNELHRDHLRHNYPGVIDVTSDARFEPREFRCLLQALLGGTLLLSQYSGRMLPTSLINFLRSHIDDATQKRFDYAYQRLDPSQVDVRMFWNVIESDTILDITTSPYVDLQHWFVLFSAAIRQPNFPDPIVLVRNGIQVHQRSFAAEASHIVSTQVELFRSTRMTTVSDNNLSSTPPSSPPTADSPMTNLEQRLLAFHRSMSNTPQRHSPGHRPRANRDVHDIVTEQYHIALHSPYGSAFHTRDATYMRRQEFLFRSNMAEQLARFGRTPHTDYSSILPPTLVSRSLVLDNNTSINSPPPHSVSPFTQDLINAHETQQQIQLQHIQDTGVTSNAANTILAMNAHAVLDAAESINGSSSAQTSTRGLGILRHPTSNHPFTQQHSPDPDQSLSTSASISAKETSCWPWTRPHSHLMFRSTPTTMTVAAPAYSPTMMTVVLIYLLLLLIIHLLLLSEA